MIAIAHRLFQAKVLPGLSAFLMVGLCVFATPPSQANSGRSLTSPPLTLKAKFNLQRAEPDLNTGDDVALEMKYQLSISNISEVAQTVIVKVDPNSFLVSHNQSNGRWRSQAYFCHGETARVTSQGASVNSERLRWPTGGIETRIPAKGRVSFMIGGIANGRYAGGATAKPNQNLHNKLTMNLTILLDISVVENTGAVLASLTPDTQSRMSTGDGDCAAKITVPGGSKWIDQLSDKDLGGIVTEPVLLLNGGRAF